MKKMLPPALPGKTDREALADVLQSCARVQERAANVLLNGAAAFDEAGKLSNRESLSLAIGELDATLRRAKDLRLVHADLVHAGDMRKRAQFAAAEDA